VTTHPPESASRPAFRLPHGWRLIVLPRVTSTQDVARDALARGEAGDPSGTGALVVWGGEQTGGRGRHGRFWQSPPDNLYVSVALPCPQGLSRATDLGFIAGVSLARTLEDLGLGRRPGLPAPRLKWPNDVLVDGGKLSGLLLESAAGPDGTPWVLLGMGVNLAHAPPAAETLYPPTALCDHWHAEDAGPVPEPGAVLEPLLARLAETLAMWRRDGFAPVRRAWTKHGHGLGDPVRVRLGEAVMTGVFIGLGEDGALVMRDADGGEHTVRAGDVFFPPTGHGASGRA